MYDHGALGGSEETSGTVAVLDAPTCRSRTIAESRSPDFGSLDCASDVLVNIFLLFNSSRMVVRLRI